MINHKRCGRFRRKPYLCRIMDDKKYLLDLIRQGEHQQQDFKYRVSDACKLAKSVSAFANTDGGRLLIGVRDDGHLSGVRSEEEIYMMHQAAYKYCKPEPSIQFDTFHVDGRTIVVATVPPSDKRPVCAQTEEGKMRAYIRINDENIIASPVHLALWRESPKRQGTVMTYDDTVRKLFDTLLGRMTLNQLVRRVTRSSPCWPVSSVSAPSSGNTPTSSSYSVSNSTFAN